MCLCPTDSDVKSSVDIGDGSRAYIVEEFCCHEDLSVDGDADAAVTARRNRSRCSLSSSNSPPFSLPMMFLRCCDCKETFMMHYRVLHITWKWSLN